MLPGERLLCGDCFRQIPFSRNETDPCNPLASIMKARIPIQEAAALCRFTQQGVVQTLLHGLKYRKQKGNGYFLGDMAGRALRTASPFLQVDYLVPVPLHPEKLQKRGYNQSLLIAQGMNRHLQKEICEDLLLKSENRQSQTRKNRVSRWENASESFFLNPDCLQTERFHHKHFLLVDDVVTTGATSIRCCQELLKIPGSKVSFFAIAHPE